MWETLSRYNGEKVTLVIKSTNKSVVGLLEVPQGVSTTVIHLVDLDAELIHTVLVAEIAVATFPLRKVSKPPA